MKFWQICMYSIAVIFLKCWPFFTWHFGRPKLWQASSRFLNKSINALLQEVSNYFCVTRSRRCMYMWNINSSHSPFDQTWLCTYWWFDTFFWKMLEQIVDWVSYLFFKTPSIILSRISSFYVGFGPFRPWSFRIDNFSYYQQKNL